MAVIGDLTESELATLLTTVATRIKGVTLGREGDSDRATMEIAGAAIVFLVDVAPKTPEAIGREAAIQLAGWLYGNRPHVSEHTIKDDSGTEISLRFNNSAATANGFRASGASSLVSRYVRRLGGVIA